MEPRNDYRKINDPKERLRIVLTSLQPGVNKSELCRQEGIYIQQLVRWSQEALKGAEESLKRRPRGTKNHDSEKEYLKQEINYLKELALEQARELSVLKKRPIPGKIPRKITYAF
jgi:transposase-like protein